MNRLRSIAIEERRQLVTFGLAVLVFLMTLLAVQLHDRGSTLSRAGRENRESARPAISQDGTWSPENRAAALATMTSSEDRRSHI